MTATNLTRKAQVFNYQGHSSNGQIHLVYFQGREGQHVVYEDSFGDREHPKRFAKIEEARDYWKTLRARLESEGYVAAEIIATGK